MSPARTGGIDFTDVLFDGIRTCVNACQFCFMAMLPPEARASLTLRDDDYRLSFLQGNFVTLTNVTDEEAERIVRCGLSPMNVSIHAITPEVRRSLIGRRAERGIEVLERLLAGGIEVHAQIVLCPGINDGAELAATLDWVEARPGITSLAVVPLGYTKHSRRFKRSYSDDVEASRAVVRLIEPYQERARETLGITRFQLSDEFYVDARPARPRGRDLRRLPAVLRRHRHAPELPRRDGAPPPRARGRPAARRRGAGREGPAGLARLRRGRGRDDRGPSAGRSRREAARAPSRSETTTSAATST